MAVKTSHNLNSMQFDAEIVNTMKSTTLLVRVFKSNQMFAKIKRLVK